jgi:hypothetical protein
MFYIFLCPHTQDQYLSIQKKKRQWENTCFLTSCFQQKCIHLWESWLSFEPKDFKVIINIHHHDQLGSQPHTHPPKKVTLSILWTLGKRRTQYHQLCHEDLWYLSSCKAPELTSTMFKNKTHKHNHGRWTYQKLWFHANHNFNIDLIGEPTLNFIVKNLVVMSMIIFKNWNLPLSQSPYFPINKANN